MAVSSEVKCMIGNQRLTSEQTVLALREASKHHQVRSHFKSAGPIDSDDVETLRCMISQGNKLISAAREKVSVEAHVSDEMQQMVDTMLLEFCGHSQQS